jgi:tetratricopeptide (TPR) repeat protein
MNDPVPGTGQDGPKWSRPVKDLGADPIDPSMSGDATARLADLRRAETFVRRGDRAAARAVYETLLGTDPKDVRVRVRMGALCEADGASGRAGAGEHYRRAAASYARSGHLLQATALYEQALRVDPGSADAAAAALALAEISARTDGPLAARRDFARAAERLSAGSSAEAARRARQRALAIDRQLAVRDLERRPTHALARLEAARALDPTDTATLELLCDLHIRWGRRAEAAAALRELLAVHEQHGRSAAAATVRTERALVAPVTPGAPACPRLAEGSARQPAATPTLTAVEGNPAEDSPTEPRRRPLTLGRFLARAPGSIGDAGREWEGDGTPPAERKPPAR